MIKHVVWRRGPEMDAVRYLSDYDMTPFNGSTGQIGESSNMWNWNLSIAGESGGMFLVIGLDQYYLV